MWMVRTAPARGPSPVIYPLNLLRIDLSFRGLVTGQYLGKVNTFRPRPPFTAVGSSPDPIDDQWL
jgi:hypothetical protein